MSEPTKKWNPRWDDRDAVMALMNGDGAQAVGRDEVDRFLAAFFAVVFSRTETNIVGLAKFEWVPIRGRTPDGEEFVSRSLKVSPSRYAETPAKSAPVLGDLSTDLSTDVDIGKGER